MAPGPQICDFLDAGPPNTVGFITSFPMPSAAAQIWIYGLHEEPDGQWVRDDAVSATAELQTSMVWVDVMDVVVVPMPAIPPGSEVTVTFKLRNGTPLDAYLMADMQFFNPTGWERVPLDNVYLLVPAAETGQFTGSFSMPWSTTALAISAWKFEPDEEGGKWVFERRILQHVFWKLTFPEARVREFNAGYAP